MYRFKQHRLTVPLATIGIITTIVTANVSYVQTTQALSLNDIITSLLGKKKEQTKPTVSPSETAPSQSTPQATPSSTTQQAAPTSETKQPTTTAPVTPTTASAQTAPSAPIAALSAQTQDTAAATLATASAQAKKVDTSAQYASARISGDSRDRLYAVAGSIAVIGAALYGMTLLQTTQRRQVAVARRPLYSK